MGDVEAERAWQAALQSGAGGAQNDADAEAERAWAAAVNGGQGDGGEGDDDGDDSEMERAWAAAQQQAMRSAGLPPEVMENLSAEEIDAMAERAFAAQLTKEGKSGEAGAVGPATTLASLSLETARVTNLPPHWEGFITDIERVWDIKFEDIKFGEQIGVGAFGSVHKGTYFGTSVAVKTVFTEGDETNLMYLMREINVLKGCRHPHIVQFMGISNDSTNHLLHIVTEYVRDGDLRGKLKDPKVKIPWDIRAKIARDLASAMAYLHTREIIHRDLKSKNILVDNNWNIKLCDFGFARTCEAKQRPMTLCGTEAWMAPEIIVGQPYGAAADVFSFGIVLCELVSRGKVSVTIGRIAEDGFCFNAEKFTQIVPPDCPEDFKSAIVEACAFDQDHRPQFHDLSEHFELLHKDLEVERTGRLQEVSSALAKFRNAAAALTAPLIEKGTVRERRNGLQRKVAEAVDEPTRISAVALKEQKSTRRVVNPRVNAMAQVLNTLVVPGGGPPQSGRFRAISTPVAVATTTRTTTSHPAENKPAPTPKLGSQIAGGVQLMVPAPGPKPAAPVKPTTMAAPKVNPPTTTPAPTAKSPTPTAKSPTPVSQQNLTPTATPKSPPQASPKSPPQATSSAVSGTTTPPSPAAKSPNTSTVTSPAKFTQARPTGMGSPGQDPRARASNTTATPASPTASSGTGTSSPAENKRRSSKFPTVQPAANVGSGRGLVNNNTIRRSNTSGPQSGL